uniref:RNA exonuclease 1 homolog n=1 Tax=Equus asinus TaxID=9793 RepID=A0A9L0K1D9_EQUAS
MLRSTGFFRAIDCPYWAGAPGGPCRRPYCHFRHRGARGPGAPGGGGGAAPPAAGLGYDPYNPELPKPPVQRENGALGREDTPRSDILELELVNQAIEAVRSEVELEQRRYQELLETAREHGSAEAPALAPRGPAACTAASLDEDAFSLSFDYNPSGRSLLSPDATYQPTPLAAPAEPGSKYSLASLDRAQGHSGGGGGALEYVPKAVSQPRRYSRPVPSGKYVVDDSKPSTDLEYDPLSNFSARLLGRAGSKDDRAPKRPRGARAREPYTPAPKKPCDPFGGCDARFSDSDDDQPEWAPRARSPESRAPGTARSLRRVAHGRPRRWPCSMMWGTSGSPPRAQASRPQPSRPWPSPAPRDPGALQHRGTGTPPSRSLSPLLPRLLTSLLHAPKPSPAWTCLGLLV